MSEQDSLPDDLELESLLRNVALAQPTRRLDQRVEAVLRPRWRMFIGPLSGFAAGILMTLAVFRFAPWAAAHPALPPQQTGAMPIAGPAHSDVPSAPAPVPVRAMMIASRNVATLGDGEVNGLPVRLEQTQSRLVLFHPTTDGGMWRAVVEMPRITTVRNAPIY